MRNTLYDDIIQTLPILLTTLGHSGSKSRCNKMNSSIIHFWGQNQRNPQRNKSSFVISLAYACIMIIIPEQELYLKLYAHTTVHKSQYRASKVFVMGESSLRRPYFSSYMSMERCRRINTFVQYKITSSLQSCNLSVYISKSSVHSPSCSVNGLFALSHPYLSSRMKIAVPHSNSRSTVRFVGCTEYQIQKVTFKY